MAYDYKAGRLSLSQFQLSLLGIRDFSFWSIQNELENQFSVKGIALAVNQGVDKEHLLAGDVLTFHEVEWLKDHITDPFNEALFSLLVPAGLRTGEICRLSPAHFHLDEDKRTFYLNVEGERPCDNRRVTIPADDLAALQNYCNQYGRSLTDKSSEPIFRSPTRKQLTKKTIYNRLQRLGLKAGFGRSLTATKFRDSFAFWRFLGGQSLITLKTTLGIGDIATLEGNLSPYAPLRDNWLVSSDSEGSFPFLPSSP